MGVCLYKPGDRDIEFGFPCIREVFDTMSLDAMLEDGWKLTPEEVQPGYKEKSDEVEIALDEVEEVEEKTTKHKKKSSKKD